MVSRNGRLGLLELLVEVLSVLSIGVSGLVRLAAPSSTC